MKKNQTTQTNILSVSDRYYDQMPEYFQGYFKDRCESMPHRYKSDKSEFDYFSQSVYFYEVNRLYAQLVQSKFPYFDFVKENFKYKLDSRFSYVIELNDEVYKTGKTQRMFAIVFWEQWNCWPNYKQNWILCHIVLHDGEDQISYSVSNFRGITLMRRSHTMNAGMGYTTKEDQIYQQSQRIQHPETIALLKTIGKFKYLPIEKFEKINYFHLLNATPEMIGCYEILLKMKAVKIATGLLLNRKMISKEEYKHYKNVIQRNRAYSAAEEVRYKLEEAKHKLADIERKKIQKMESEQIDIALSEMKRVVVEHENFVLFNPTSMKEMEHESNVLQHCLGRRLDYAKRILEGSSAIYFLRKAEEPEQPFYTVELQGDKIIQCRTTSNRSDESITSIMQQIIKQYPEVLAHA